jgi:RNA polymerase sigma factor (sigma-70 family)
LERLNAERWGGSMSLADLPDARDEELLRQVTAGDEEAFRALFRRYAPTALALARRVSRDDALAEEIVQEVFLAVWRMPDRFDPGLGSVRAWVMNLVHRRTVDAIRREASQRRRSEIGIPDDVVVVGDPADDVVTSLDLPGEREAVRSALSALPDEQRQVIELMYFGGLTQSMIAERLSLPLGTVKSRTLLGMRRLRISLAGGER